MNDEFQTRLAEASKMLTEAKSLNAYGNHGAAIKLAYGASEHIASGYLAGFTEQPLVPSDAAYDLFAKTIREPNRHPALLQKIKEIVGDISALREAYEPALLGETTLQDARQMIEHVAALLGLTEQIAGNR